MIWVGIVLMVVAVILVVLAKRSSGRAAHMETTETSKIADIEGLVGEISADLPGGVAGTGYSQFVELKGVVSCDAPITGELSGETVAIAETRVERKIETRQETRDSEGNIRTSWRKTTETLSNNRRDAPFYLDDGSGRVRVSPDGAKLDLLTAVDRFEPPTAVEQGGAGQLSVGIGSFRFSLGGGLLGSDRRTIGYRFIERILPVGREIYALGEIVDAADGLMLRKPTEKGKPYLLSLKSEEELVRATERSAGIMRWVAIGLVVAGVALALIDLLR